MTPERTQAYGRIVHTLAELGPSKLLEAEQECVRDAADSLIFTSNLRSESSAREALARVEGLCERLVGCGRWEEVTARRLLTDLWSCGPAPVVLVRAA